MVKGVASARSQNIGSSPNKEELTLSPITWCFSLIHLPFYFACLHVPLCSQQFRKSVCLLDIASRLTVSVLIFVAFAEIIEFFVVYFICARDAISERIGKQTLKNVRCRNIKWKQVQHHSPASARQRSFTRWRLRPSTFTTQCVSRKSKIIISVLRKWCGRIYPYFFFFFVCAAICKQHTLFRRFTYWFPSGDWWFFRWRWLAPRTSGCVCVCHFRNGVGNPLWKCTMNNEWK